MKEWIINCAFSLNFQKSVYNQGRIQDVFLRGGGLNFCFPMGPETPLKLVAPWIRPWTAPLIYPILLADPSGILEVPRPGEAEGAPLEVPVGEHVRQAEGVIVLLWK